MDCSNSFEVKCRMCGMGERLTFSEMATKELVQCKYCGTTRSMRKEDILDICRDATKMTRQRL